MFALHGQTCLIGPDSPIRHKAQRRRIKTVMQELVYQSARLLERGRQFILRFGRHSPGLSAFMNLFPRKTALLADLLFYTVNGDMLLMRAELHLPPELK